jgi:hypothetical protein
MALGGPTWRASAERRFEGDSPVRKVALTTTVSPLAGAPR